MVNLQETMTFSQQDQVTNTYGFIFTFTSHITTKYGRMVSQHKLTSLAFAITSSSQDKL